jgi:hypothetical protein
MYLFIRTPALPRGMAKAHCPFCMRFCELYQMGANKALTVHYDTGKINSEASRPSVFESAPVGRSLGKCAACRAD